MAENAIDELRRRGPLTNEKMRSDPYSFSVRGRIGRFDLGGQGPTGRPKLRMGQTKTVYYLRGEHDPLDVVVRWFEANPEATKHDTRVLSLHIEAHDPSFVDAASAIHPRADG